MHMLIIAHTYQVPCRTCSPWVRRIWAVSKRLMGWGAPTNSDLDLRDFFPLGAVGRSAQDEGDERNLNGGVGLGLVTTAAGVGKPFDTQGALRSTTHRGDVVGQRDRLTADQLRA
jgi:hypothetical protein